MQHHNEFFQVNGPMANLGGIAIWEGPIAYLMCVQYLKTDAHPLHVLYCWTFYGGSFAKLTQQNSSFWGYGKHPTSYSRHKKIKHIQKY